MLQIVSFISVTVSFSRGRAMSAQLCTKITTNWRRTGRRRPTFGFDVLLVLLLLLGFPLPSLNAVFPHGHGPVDAVQFEVEAAGVTDGLAVVVPPPERRLRGVAVGAAQSVSPRRRREHLRHRHRLEVHLKIFLFHWNNSKRISHVLTRHPPDTRDNGDDNERLERIWTPGNCDKKHGDKKITGKTSNQEVQMMNCLPVTQTTKILNKAAQLCYLAPHQVVTMFAVEIIIWVFDIYKDTWWP